MTTSVCRVHSVRAQLFDGLGCVLVGDLGGKIIEEMAQIGTYDQQRGWIFPEHLDGLGHLVISAFAREQWHDLEWAQQLLEERQLYFQAMFRSMGAIVRVHL